MTARPIPLSVLVEAQQALSKAGLHLYETGSQMQLASDCCQSAGALSVFLEPYLQAVTVPVREGEAA